MRVECDWVILSEVAIVQDGNHAISLINLIDNVTVNPNFTGRATNGRQVVAFRTVISSQWTAEAPTGDKQYHIAIRNAADEVMFEQLGDIGFSNHALARSRLNMVVLPFEGDGKYTVRVRCVASDEVTETPERAIYFHVVFPQV